MKCSTPQVMMQNFTPQSEVYTTVTSNPSDYKNAIEDTTIYIQCILGV